MDVKLTDAGPCRKVLEVRAPAEDVAGTYSETLAAYARSAKLPGFRPGKAPLKVVEKHYAREIADDAKDRVVPKLYREALAQKGLTPVAIVEVQEVTFDKERGVDFRVTVDVAPEFKLPKYHQIPVVAQPVNVGDEQVDGAIQRMQERFARFQPVSGRVAHANDLLRVDYDATCDGKPVVEMLPDDRQMGEARDFLLFLGEPEFLPGFKEALIGVEANGEREITVAFPEDFGAKPLAGRSALYRVRVKEIQERLLPPLEGEFLKMLGVETEAALRERMLTDLRETAQRQEEGRQKDEIARYLLAQTEFDLPQSVVEQETRLAVRSMVQEISRRGASREQIVEQQDKIVSSATQTSTERVKLSYILNRIAREEQVEVDAAEVDARIREMAVRYPMTPERLREELDKRDAMSGVEGDVRAEKTLVLLLREAKIKTE
jgi:trigger factor